MTKPRSETAPERTMTAFRCSVDELAEITRIAGEYGMTRTEYILLACLQKLPDEARETENRLDDHERRLKRLEELAFGN